MHIKIREVPIQEVSACVSLAVSTASRYTCGFVGTVIRFYAAVTAQDLPPITERCPHLKLLSDFAIVFTSTENFS